ncbi:exonuclease 1-like [Mercenaria mercenaria]|uniref:exonuclease 1-like n=1 Tax=Mercenaria mercenaria TaxID=6596 RepID=UPI00234EA96E|nr:exonuclease 1-like [Mercenaria mercenaria]
MGIQGLLPFLKKIHQPVNVAQFAGCTVAIDAYCWLHKGAFSCAEKLALGEKTDQYVYYCMKFINNLLSKNIKPVLVFDGCHLPSKKNVEKSRREKRELNKKKAAQFLREGKRAEARECLQRCIDITPEMALELMNTCRERGVDCIVAPYEADAQLAYLNKIGVAQVIITEDSDLLLFGCEKVLFKMDHAGNGILIERKRLNEVTAIQGGHYQFDKFRYMCILSGCDYLPSLSGIGLVRANKVFKIARQPDIEQLLKKLPTYLKSNISVPQEYIDGFVAANNTFLYQFVFDPLQRRLVPLNPYQEDVNPDELSYAGAHIPSKKALQIALGNVNIYSGEMFASFDPDTFVPKYVKKKPEMLHMLSIWDRNYRVKPKAALHETQLPDRPNLKGKEISVKANFKKRSPHKRVREVEDSKAVKSDTELYDIYHSPVKKKQKMDDIDDDLHRFIFASKEEVEDQDEGTAEEETKSGLKNSPQFFNSLSEAHPEVKVETENDMDNDVEKENMVSPRRNIFASKSPSKRFRFNLNAPKQKELKSRFFASNVKADDERNEKSESQTSSPARDREENYLLSQYKPVHSNTANVYSPATSNSPSKTDIKIVNAVKEDFRRKKSEVHDDSSVSITEVPRQHFKFSKAVTNRSPKFSPQGGSAFNWSKFKFNRASSSDNISLSNKTSRDVKKPFKKVVSESNLETFLKKTDKAGNSKDTESVEIENITSLDDESMATGSDNSAPLSSYPYSIDSDCLSDFYLGETECELSHSRADSQQNDASIVTDTSSINDDKNNSKSGLSIYFKPSNYTDSQISADEVKNNAEMNERNENSTGIYGQQCDERREDGRNNTGKHSVVLIDSDDETFSEFQLPTPIPEAVGISSKLNKGKAKPGCKVSGLSRRSKKSSSSSQDTSGKQQNLKDMFAKFSHKKSEKPRLSHGTIDCDTDDAFTPEGRSSHVGRSNGVQRVLLK